MFDISNEKILLAVSSLLADGKIDAEGAGKLLNTVARFEERTQEIERSDHNNQDD